MHEHELQAAFQTKRHLIPLAGAATRCFVELSSIKSRELARESRQAGLLLEFMFTSALLS